MLAAEALRLAQPPARRAQGIHCTQTPAMHAEHPLATLSPEAAFGQDEHSEEAQNLMGEAEEAGADFDAAAVAASAARAANAASDEIHYAVAAARA